MKSTEKVHAKMPIMKKKSYIGISKILHQMKLFFYSSLIKLLKKILMVLQRSCLSYLFMYWLTGSNHGQLNYTVSYNWLFNHSIVYSFSQPFESPPVNLLLTSSDSSSY